MMKLEERIFAEALDHSFAERAAFVARACGGDMPLEARMMALLRGYDGAGARLEVSPLGDSAELLRTQASRRVEYEEGSTIGPYTLLHKLGEGGCGGVYLAEQRKPVRRQVALKIIKLGMDTREMIARFEAERQALALMDHPNIAHVLDAGATAQGRPFFVMEPVHGVPVTQFCDEQRLSLTERVRLFIQICSALEHAHQKGVIHRDLKPSNLLVAMQDGAPAPKIIDFGIAKAMHERLTERTLLTAGEQFIGTPAYMSPEQLETGGRADVDTRSDIYSLGVLLYELLAGRTPFAAGELMRGGVDELRRIVREKEPLRPSAYVHSLSPIEALVLATRRRTDPTRLRAWLQGDIDWIVMRCLEKDRSRRYGTASGLALDLQRFLRNEPVSARPPSTVYTLCKLMRRNKLLFGALAAVVMALATGLTLSALALLREREARQQADLEASRSLQLARLMEDMLAGVGPQVALGRDTRLLRTILDETVVRMNTSLANHPDVEASFRETLGGIYRDLREYSAAGVMYERALRLRRDAWGNDHPAVAGLLHELGEVRRNQGRWAEAAALLSEAAEIRERRLGIDHVDTRASRNAALHVRRLMGNATPSLGAAGESSPTEAPAAPITVIRIGMAGGFAGGKPLMPNVLSLAYQQRILEQEFATDGIRIEWSSPSYYTAREIAARGDLDLAEVGPLHAWSARIVGLGHKLVLPSGGLHARMALVVPSDGPIQTLADLQGRRVGICLNTRSHLALCRLIERHGLQVAGFRFVSYAGHAAIDTAFSAGELEACMAESWGAGLALLAGARIVAVESEFDADSAGKLVVSAEFERRHPEVVQRVVTALVKAAAWISYEPNRETVLAAWAHSPERLKALRAASAGPRMKLFMSPLFDDFYQAKLRRDGEDARRFGLLPPDAELNLDGWLEPKYVERALIESGLVGYWSERNTRGEFVSTP